MKTKVRFYLEKEDGKENVLAVFPETNNGKDTVQCYSYFGEHSHCTTQYANSLEPCPFRQYIGMKLDLESMGYELDILN
jgi:hypothetical protein